MIVDSRSVPQGSDLETDVCIVGAGAAGITLAREFSGREFRVALLESGSLTSDADTQALYRGDSSGHSYFPLEACRVRYFGGTTNHWGGTCRPMDASDFEKREWVSHSGWPLSRTDLDPFYVRAQAVCQLGPYDYATESWVGEDRKELPLEDDRIRTSVFQQSPPTRFGHVYREDVVGASNLQTYLHANVVEVQASDNAAEVTGVRVATLAGNQFTMRARIFILATGGIEAPRLLLASNGVETAGLGNSHDLVGRFFLEHPILQIGVVLLADPHMSVDLYSKNNVGGTVVKGFLSPTPEVQQSRGILNFGTRPNLINWRQVSPANASLQVLKEAWREKTVPDNLFSHISNVIRDLGDFMGDDAEDARRKVLALKYWQECEPNPDSRVMLGSERDSLGMRRTDLHWAFTELDRTTMAAAIQLIGEEFGRAGIGRLNVKAEEKELWSRHVAGSFHHMGTTRMSDKPESGVVDRNLRVHSVANLYVASSSVFPTTGHANPTLTIAALAIRLADHVKERLS